MINAMRTPGDRRWYHLSLATLILAAWGASPFAGLLDHHASRGEAISPIFRLAVFVVGWTLMTVAMMLPSSMPLVTLFRRFVLHRADGARLLWLLGLGYLGVWTYFGLLTYLGDGLLHAAVASLPALQAASGGIAAAILLLAGAYQFTPLKMMCLEKCRSP